MRLVGLRRSDWAVARGSVTQRTALAAGLLLLLLGASVVAHDVDPPTAAAHGWPESYRQDANLFDVCFVNSQLGWAVGDRGTILHTQDGGETWQLQDCPTRGRLEAVHFINSQQGWAVGGSSIAYTHRSVGIVLHTDDGGRTWQQQPAQFLPWLTGIQFSDPQRGVAFGLPSAMYPAAVFHTQDGGSHWTPWPGWSVGWVDGRIDDQRQGLLVDRSGQLVRVKQRGLTPLGKLQHESRLPLRIAAEGQGPWWLCGNQGLLQVSYDEGEAWLAPRGLPDANVLAEFDWQDVESLGQRAWIAGVPGSAVLRTEDGGRTWALSETGQALPVYAVDFVEPQHGWAVGALGTVLATRDGGRTWNAQRGARRRLSVLGIFGEAERVPWEAIAQLAADDGYWTRIEVLGDGVACRARAGQTPVSTRLHEATVMLGGVGANLIESLPAPDARLQVPARQVRGFWDQVTRSDSSGQLTEYLVRQIRTWQPDLVIVSEPVGEHDGLNHLTRQLVLQATEKAADTTQYPAQLQAGLLPWRVSRVTTVSSDVNDHGYAINAAQLVTSLGQSVGHLAGRARVTVAASRRPAPQRMMLRMLDGDTPARRGLFAAAGDASDAVTRRDHNQLADDIRQAGQHALRRRNLESILSETPSDQLAVWQQAMHLAGELSADHRGELFLNAAANRLRTGQSAMAFELLEHVQRLPEPFVPREPARLWLFWYLASEEAAMHWPLATTPSAQQVTQAGTIRPATGDLPGAALATASGFEDDAPAVMTASAAVDVEQAVQNRFHQAERMVELIQAEQPDLYFEPMLRFPLAALQRRTGQTDAARQFWRSQLSGRTDPAFRTWASSELAIMESKGLLSRPCWDSLRVREPPRLDGALDDDAWQSVPATRLAAVPPVPADDVTSSTRVRLAYDAKYLYLAVHADKIPSLAYTGRDELRQRDAVADADRLEIYLDVDRDAVTYWQLAIDHRGGAAERLNEDASWNPPWYIAAADDESTWTIEAAIELESLSLRPVTPGECWCLGVQRIMPGHGWETWLQPAPIEARPEELGLLRFQ